MYVRVVSSSLQPSDITARLNAEPDESSAIGSRRRPELPPRGHTSWIRRAVAPEAGARPEDLEPSVLAWGTEFAAALGALAESGAADVSLVIVQRIQDPDGTAEKGIFLGAELIRWLATAGASLDVDQYVLHECEQSQD
ncbi:uncharacterized protein DUF4279 [Kitasatospora atroaurantiaca]|uniref:Uncharacterized protein DUF4279 n=2 Tax=Kitasatospora atroaurantiaca TaxID=285545 RepID=A0A561EV00_9ACTN|nr:uncharacterized protein DUF4279 [Kitasatospora atroaurantiaca]